MEARIFRLKSKEKHYARFSLFPLIKLTTVACKRIPQERNVSKKPSYTFRMEDMNDIDPLVYQPFGVAPRNCIGMRFAVMEIKICKILLSFRLDPAEDTPVRHQLVFCSLTYCHVSVRSL